LDSAENLYLNELENILDINTVFSSITSIKNIYYNGTKEDLLSKIDTSLLTNTVFYYLDYGEYASL